jgi:hypothetical protein
MSWSRQNAPLNAQLQQRRWWVAPTLDGALELAAGCIHAALGVPPAR